MLASRSGASSFQPAAAPSTIIHIGALSEDTETSSTGPSARVAGLLNRACRCCGVSPARSPGPAVGSGFSKKMGSYAPDRGRPQAYRLQRPWAPANLSAIVGERALFDIFCGLTAQQRDAAVAARHSPATSMDFPTIRPVPGSFRKAAGGHGGTLVVFLQPLVTACDESRQASAARGTGGGSGKIRAKRVGPRVHDQPLLDRRRPRD